MNLNQGKRNKQAVQVLNKVEYDSEGNPIGMMEDPSNPASANFGTPREPRRGGCYLGNGSAYITITGLLSTDTVEVMEGSDAPIISNGRLDIASGDKVFGVKIFRAGELWGKYNCSENSGDICYDSSGNGHHGTIVNAITTTPEENPNSIHQYQDVYSFENGEGYSELGNVLIPKNSSITLPPFKDVLGNNLQYVGKVPGKAKFVGSSCFLSDGNAYMTGNVLTTDTITAHSESEVPVCTVDGRLDFPVVGGKYFDVTIERSGSVIARLPLCEPIIDPSNHIYHDVSGNGNHATLVNGTLANEGKQDEFHYLQRGFNIGKFVSANSENWNNNATGWNNYQSSCIYSVSNNILTIEAAPDKNGQFIFNNSIFPIGKTYRIYCRARCVSSSEAKIRVFCGSWVKSILVSDEFSEYVVEGVIVYLSRAYIQIYNSEVFEIDYIRYYIGDTLVPIKYNGEGFPDGGYIESGILQDSHSFLNTGTELEAYDYPALKQADKDDDFWYEDDGLGTVTPKPVQFDNLITQKGLSDKLFLDSSVSETIKNVRIYGNDLKGRQLNTENKLTNNV